MTEQKARLLKALQELEETVPTLLTAQPKPNLLPLFERIDALAQELPADTDPSLLHYLQKRSYQKALRHLQGRDRENTTGSCGHL